MQAPAQSLKAVSPIFVQITDRMYPVYGWLARSNTANNSFRTAMNPILKLKALSRSCTKPEYRFKRGYLLKIRPEIFMCTQSLRISKNTSTSFCKPEVYRVFLGLQRNYGHGLEFVIAQSDGTELQMVAEALLALWKGKISYYDPPQCDEGPSLVLLRHRDITDCSVWELRVLSSYCT